MKKILFSFSLLLIYFCCLNVSAIDACTTSEMTRLRELANNVNFSYQHYIDAEFEEEENVYDHFLLQVLNLDDDLRIYYRDANNELVYLSQEELEATEYYSGKRVFYVYSYTDNLCTDELLRTITLDLPVYNSYYHYNQDRCSEYPDFEYCEEYKDIKEVRFEDIDNEFEDYISSLRVDEFIDTVKDNYIYIVIGGVLIIAIVVIIVVKKHKAKKNSDL